MPGSIATSGRPKRSPANSWPEPLPPAGVLLIWRTEKAVYEGGFRARESRGLGAAVCGVRARGAARDLFPLPLLRLLPVPEDDDRHSPEAQRSPGGIPRRGQAGGPRALPRPDHPRGLEAGAGLDPRGSRDDRRESVTAVSSRSIETPAPGLSPARSSTPWRGGLRRRECARPSPRAPGP